jgi:thiol-disulfide isomerase/thioredoxin
MKTLASKHLLKALLSIVSTFFCFSALTFADEAQTLPINSVSSVSSVAGEQQRIYFKDYLGKVVLLDFWASWCGPCRQSFPWMNVMQEKYKDQGFEIIAINLDSEPEDAFDFLKEIPANFTLGFDSEGLTAEKMNVEAMPMSYLIDRQGKIRQRLIGFNTTKKAEHETHIQTLLTDTK